MTELTCNSVAFRTDHAVHSLFFKWQGWWVTLLDVSSSFILSKLQFDASDFNSGQMDLIMRAMDVGINWSMDREICPRKFFLDIGISPLCPWAFQLQFERRKLPALISTSMLESFVLLRGFWASSAVSANTVDVGEVGQSLNLRKDLDTRIWCNRIQRGRKFVKVCLSTFLALRWTKWPLNQQNWPMELFEYLLLGCEYKSRAINLARTFLLPAQVRGHFDERRTLSVGPALLFGRIDFVLAVCVCILCVLLPSSHQSNNRDHLNNLHMFPTDQLLCDPW